jgi:FAD/FMN-containing dehydrogenase
MTLSGITQRLSHQRTRPPYPNCFTSGVTDSLADALIGIVGSAHVLTGPDMCAPYETDWTRRFSGRSRLVVRPGDAGQVAAIIVACADAGARVVPQGGNTGLVGGGVPRDGEVLVSLRRLEDVADADPVAARLVAGAGATLASVQHTARAAGLAVGVDLASRDSATIGGMIATNAGGIHVIRYGPMRAQVLGVEAVLADGSTLSLLDGPLHSSAGYDLTGLLAGSEGTLAIITRAALRLVPEPTDRAVALIGASDTADAMALAAAARALPSLDAIELFHDSGLALVRSYSGLAAPLERDWPAYLLVECAGSGGTFDELSAFLTGTGADRDIAVAVDPQERRRLWAYREQHTEAIAAAGIAHKFDVSLPLSRLAGFVAAADARVAAHSPQASTITFGHAGVGNVHINVLGLAPDDAHIDDVVFRVVAEYGGSISAEHGVGTAKRDWLHLTHSAVEIAAMRAVKQAFDPKGMLNPGVLLPAQA